MDGLTELGYTPDDILDLIKEVELAREDMLGSHEYRMENNGKAEFESHWRAEPLQGAPRCYGLNNMIQRSRRLESPPAALKTYGDEQDSYQKKINNFNRVSLWVSASCLYPVDSEVSRSQQSWTLSAGDVRGHQI